MLATCWPSAADKSACLKAPRWPWRLQVKNKTDGKNYVIKEIDVSRMPRAEREASQQEAKLLMALKHPNIVSCKETFQHQVRGDN